MWLGVGAMECILNAVLDTFFLVSDDIFCPAAALVLESSTKCATAVPLLLLKFDR